MGDNDKKPAIKFYLRPEFFLIVLTAFLWFAFLAKVITQDKIPGTLKMNSNKISKRIPDKTYTIKSHNKPGTPNRKQLIKDKETNQEETAIDALRESLEKVKPADNLIIRGKTMTLIQRNGRNAMPAAELIINQENLKSLNNDYRKALNLNSSVGRFK